MVRWFVPLVVAAVGYGALMGCSSMSKRFDDSSLLYLEEVEGEKALDWVRAQNERSLKQLESDPLYPVYFEQVKKILTAQDRIPYGRLRDGWVYNFWQDEKSVRGVWRRATLSQYQKSNPRWQTLLNVDQLAKDEEENWVYKGTDCLAPRYDRCLISLSRGGKDAKVVREFDVSRKKFVKDGFVLPEAKSAVAWLDENLLLVGTDWGEGSLTESGYPRIVKKWKRGALLSSAKTIYEGDKTSVGVWPVSVIRPEGNYQFIVDSLNFFESDYYMLKGDEVVKLPLPKHVEFVDVFKGQMVLKLRDDWRYKHQGETAEFSSGDLVSFSLNEFMKTGELGALNSVFRPTQTMAVQNTGSTREVLYISYLDNVVGKVLDLRFENGRWVSKPVPVADNGTVSLISTDPFYHLSFLSFESYIDPTQLYVLNSKSNSLRKIKQLPARFSSKGLTVTKGMAKSRDGTQVPYFLVHRKDMKRDGTTPTLLYGYGGFEIALTPYYSATVGKTWLENGGAFVVANIRGGGEFGPRWHQAALKENRQKAFDDFIAVAEDLIQEKVTSREHLGIQGGSNGGLLVGAVFTQRPELFDAVVCQVPLLDMLRFHLLLAGASWKAEYGDPEVRSEKKVLESYSPFHNIKADQTYPEVFFVTSTKDDRVHPGHARKMAAKMEALGKPFLYYENIEGGHSASANLIQRAKQTALQMVYLTRKLELKAPEPKKAP